MGRPASCGIVRRMDPKGMSRVKHSGLAAVITDPEISARISTIPGVRIYKTVRPSVLQNYNQIVVSVSLSGLSEISGFVREANERHYLRNLLVYDEASTNLLPQVMVQANIRTYRNLIVHSDVNVPARILNARSIGAEDALIADARISGDSLFVIACSGSTCTLPLGEIRSLPELDPKRVSDFHVESDGSYITWPDADSDLDLQTIRELIDPAEREKAIYDRLLKDRRFGQAIAELRRTCHLRQSDIKGITARQIRRIEADGCSRPATLAKLARAHQMDLNTYLGTLAERIPTLPGPSTRAFPKQD